MKFNSIEEAKMTILNGHFMCEKAMKVGDFKTNNRIVLKEVNPAFEYLKSNDSMSSLAEFLEHEDIDFRILIARELLPYYEDIATLVLQEVEKTNAARKGYMAKIILDQWREKPWE